MRTLIATILAVFASSALATGSVDHDWSSAGAGAKGAGLTKSFAVSASTGNGYSVNSGYASSRGVITGYARDNLTGTYKKPNGQTVGYENGYKAGVTIDTYAHTKGYSAHGGLAKGGTFNFAAAGGVGVAGGEADSHTHPVYSYCGGNYLGPHVSEAESKAGGIVGAGAISLTKTTGNMWGGTKAGASVGLDVWGVADTEKHSFVAGAKTTITPDTYSVSYGNVPPVWSGGYAKTGGIAGAGGIAGEHFDGYVIDD